MLQNTHGARPRLLPGELHNEFGARDEKMPRVANQSHPMNWVNAMKVTDTTLCPFSSVAHLTEITLLGVASLRANNNLLYGGATMTITNYDAANQLLTRGFRTGVGLV